MSFLLRLFLHVSIAVFPLVLLRHLPLRPAPQLMLSSLNEPYTFFLIPQLLFMHS